MAAEFVTSDLALEAGLEDLPCGNGAGGLNGCGVAAAIVIGFCACQSENSDDTLDKADIKAMFDDDRKFPWEKNPISVTAPTQTSNKQNN